MSNDLDESLYQHSVRAETESLRDMSSLSFINLTGLCQECLIDCISKQMKVCIVHNQTRSSPGLAMSRYDNRRPKT